MALRAAAATSSSKRKTDAPTAQVAEPVVPKGDIQVINLNSLKRGSDNKFHRLEIPVALAKPAD